MTRLSTTTTLAVLSTKIIIHETSQQQKTYVPHGIDGLYVGSSLEHYFCYKCYLQKINSTRDFVTFEWFPTTIPFPKVSHEIYLLQTTEYILAILQTKKLAPDSPMDTPSPTPTSKWTKSCKKPHLISKHSLDNSTPLQQNRGYREFQKEPLPLRHLHL